MAHGIMPTNPHRPDSVSSTEKEDTAHYEHAAAPEPARNNMFLNAAAAAGEWEDGAVAN